MQMHKILAVIEWKCVAVAVFWSNSRRKTIQNNYM